MEVNRRNFIKGSSAVALSGTIAGCGFQSDSEPQANSSLPKAATSWQHVVCPRNCGDRCSLLVATENGVATEIIGDPAHPVTAGMPCVKGQTYLQSVYSVDRIKTPLKRIGARGPNAQFEPISWEQAYTEIANKLNAIISEHGGNAVLPYSYSGHLGKAAQAMQERLWNKIGSRILERNICASAGYAGISSILGDFNGPTPEDHIHTRCYVSWGHNEQATNVHHFKFINQARDQGAKVLVVNPVRTPLASQADIWLQPKPGTDAMLVIGIAKCIISEGLEDKSFIANHTQDYSALLARLDEFTHQDVTAVTGVEYQQYRDFAIAYASAKPAIIKIGYGMQRALNGGRMTRAIPILAAITGNFGKLGSGVLYLNAQIGATFNSGYITGAHLADPTHQREKINISEIARSLLPEDHQHENGLVGPLAYGKPSTPVKAMVVYSSNPMAIAPNTGLLAQALQRPDLFLVGVDLFKTDTMDYMDYILPCTSFIEQEDIVDGYNSYYIKFSNKIIEPLHQSKPDWVIFGELAQKMGFVEPEFKESLPDALEKGWQGRSSFTEFKQNKWEHGDFIERPWRANLIFPTPSGKIEFKDSSGTYFDPKQFHPVIDVATPENSASANFGLSELEKAREYRLLTPANPKLLNSQWANIKYIQGTFPEYGIYIHPMDAKAKKIKTGDAVKVTATRYNGDIAVVHYTAVVEEMTAPGTVLAWKCTWLKLNENGQFTAVNQLTNDALSDMNGCSTYHSTRVDISLA